MRKDQDPLDAIRKAGHALTNELDEAEANAVLTQYEGDEGDLEETDGDDTALVVRGEVDELVIFNETQDGEVGLERYEAHGTTLGLSNAGSVERGVDISGPKDWQNIDVRGLNLSDQDFSGRDMPGARMIGTQTLERAKFVQTRMVGCRFTGANIREADFTGAICGEIIDFNNQSIGAIDAVQAVPYFDGADATGANFSQGEFRLGSFVGTIMNGAYCEEGVFIAVDFTNLVARDADFSGAGLQFARFKNADISGSSLQDCDLSGTDMRGAIVEGVDWRNVTVSSATKLPEGAPKSLHAEVLRLQRQILEVVDVVSEEATSSQQATDPQSLLQQRLAAKRAEFAKENS